MSIAHPTGRSAELSDILSSWSRRRAAVAAEAEQDVSAAQDAALAAQQDALAEKSDAEVLEMLGLPDPDSLALGDDFKAFMSKAVPAHLRKRALRKLWRSNPVLACVDGLNDYDDDYLAQGLGQGAIKTTYQVGKGMLAHVLELERQKEAAPAEQTTVGACDDAEIEAAPPEAPPKAEAQPVQTAQAAQDDAPALATPRRMQFRFKEETA